MTWAIQDTVHVTAGCVYWNYQTFEECMEQQVSAIDGLHDISQMW